MAVPPTLCGQLVMAAFSLKPLSNLREAVLGEQVTLLAQSRLPHLPGGHVISWLVPSRTPLCQAGRAC